MFSIFNQLSSRKKNVQMVNLAALTLAAYHFVTNPEASCSEIGFDVLTHGLSFLSLAERPDGGIKFASMFVNFMRVGAIYSGVTSASSAFPLLVNLADTAVHLASGVMTLDDDEDEGILFDEEAAAKPRL